MRSSSVLVFSLLLFCSCAAVAQTGESEPILFHWYPNWQQGAFLAALGIAGALIVAFSMIGGVIPGTAGRIIVDAEQSRLDSLYARLTQLAQADPIVPDAVNALNETIDKLRDDLRSERWRQFSLGTVFYAVLGAFFASALADDVIQAVVLGATWTSFLGVFGLKQDFENRRVVKDESLRTAEDLIAVIQADVHRSVASDGSTGVADIFDLTRVRDGIKAARSV